MACNAKLASELVPLAEIGCSRPVEVLAQVVDSCTQACNCCFETEKQPVKSSRRKRIAKVAAMYVTMVVVSTLAIYFLEHASAFNAIRTALVAAVGKTIAATWVSALFN